MVKEILKLHNEIKETWNKFIDKYSFIKEYEVNNKFLIDYEKTIKKIEVNLAKMQSLVYNKQIIKEEKQPLYLKNTIRKEEK